MISLDNKLKEILVALRYRTSNFGELVDIIGIDPKAIAQIKQAFEDAGWIDPIKMIAMVLGAAPVPTEDRYGIDENGKIFGPTKELMTGSEWYERFEKELWKPPKQVRIKLGDDGESHDRFFRTGGENFMYDRAIEAAKKASS